MVRKQYFRAEVALVSLTFAVLLLFAGVLTWNFRLKNHCPESDGCQTAGNDNNSPDGNLTNGSDDDTSDDPNSSDDSGGDANHEDPESPSNPQPANSFINLQPTVDAWLRTTNRQVGLMIYDLDHDRVAASYQPNRVFSVASIYKLFYVYDGYRQLASGAENPNSYFVTTSDYRAGRYTIAQCLDLAVRESYNGCADPLRSNATRSRRVQQLINELGLTSTSNLGLESTASDITALLKLYYTHEDLPDALWAKLADSMLNQPPTEVAADTVYDWREGLPSGFSDSVKVYNKVGWAWNGESWNVYADAAIVEFPEQNRHYAMVVLTKNFANASTISNLGRMLEATILTE